MPDRSREYTPYYGEDGYGWAIYDLITSTRLNDMGRLGQLSWRPNSSGFMGEYQEGDQDWRGLAYFNRDGQLIAHILSFNAYISGYGRSLSGRSELQWSPDGRYFALVPSQSPELKNVYLIDMQEQIVIDTCLRALDSPAWSPDGTMFAYLTNAAENLNLIVVDTTTWQAYIVARHSGARSAVNYQLPEMVGWRSITRRKLGTTL